MQTPSPRPRESRIPLRSPLAPAAPSISAAAFARSGVISPSANLAGAGGVWVSGRARSGAETSPLIFGGRFFKYKKVQPRMLWCGAASGWMLDKSTVSAP